MTDIEFLDLSEINPSDIINLMNNEAVGKLMPLLAGGFSQEDCNAFLKAKKSLWDEHGYGPWAFIIQDEFAGWGGLQQEQGEADFALVLHPKFWGYGLKIFNKTKEIAFNQMGIETITVLFPPNRTNSKAIFRMGFKEDGETEVSGEMFKKFRLNKL